MAKTPNKPTTFNNYRINFWKMMRDVLIASLAKGQFLVAMAGFIIMCVVLRLPPQDLSSATFAIIDLFKSLFYLGYLGFVLIAVAWFMHAKRMRKIHTEEVKRLSSERNKWQQKALEPVQLPSSDEKAFQSK